MIKFLRHEDATTFLNSLHDRTITLISTEGTTLSLPIYRLHPSSAPVPRRISIPIRSGNASRVVVAVNFPRRCIFALLVEADLHRGFGLKSVVEVSYVEDERGAEAGTGRLTLELSSVSAAHHVKVILLHRSGLFSRLPQITNHFFRTDPCRRAADDAVGSFELPLNVTDSVGFFSRHEFLAVPRVASLPSPRDPVASIGLITRSPVDGDCSPATCPARYAKQELAIQNWTHMDADTGALRKRVPFGWSMTAEDAFKDFVFRHLETRDPDVEGVIDLFSRQGVWRT